MSDSRKLVTLRTISQITPIEGADKIECAHIDGWTCVVGKGEYYEGQKVFYFEVDSLIPLDDERFKFLEPRGKMVNHENGKMYHRLRTVKLRGQISQGLIMPWTIAYQGYDPDVFTDIELDIYDNKGGDWSEHFGVIKYEPQVPAQLRGQVKMWPEWITHTDEERVQNLDEDVIDEILRERDRWIATEKIDGTSTTIWAKIEPDGEKISSGVCSRNWGLEYDEENTYWKMALTPMIKYLPQGPLSSPFDYVKAKVYELYSYDKQEHSVVLQGETFGESIQNNPLKIKGQKIRFFNLFIDGQQVPFNELPDELEDVWVPTHDIVLAKTRDEMIKQVDGLKTHVPEADKDSKIEGIVWRHSDKPFLDIKKEIDFDKIPEEKRELVKAKSKEEKIKASFKVISNSYLLKHE